MPLSPIDVTQQTFRVSLRGYDEGEVDGFLDEVVSSMKEYDQRLRDADERVSVLEEQLQANRETEDAMRRAFVAAQRTADEIVAEARVEGERILDEARVEAVEVSAEHVRERDELKAELSGLRKNVTELKARVQALAQGILPDVEALDADLEAELGSAEQRPSLSTRVAQLSSAEEVAEHIPPFASAGETSMADPHNRSEVDLSGPEAKPFSAPEERPFPIIDSSPSEEERKFGSHRADGDHSAPAPSSGGWLTSPNEPLPGRGMRAGAGELATGEMPTVVEDSSWSRDQGESMAETGWGVDRDDIEEVDRVDETEDVDDYEPEPAPRRRPWERES